MTISYQLTDSDHLFRHQDLKLQQYQVKSYKVKINISENKTLNQSSGAEYDN